VEDLTTILKRDHRNLDNELAELAATGRSCPDGADCGARWRQPRAVPLNRFGPNESG